MMNKEEIVSLLNYHIEMKNLVGENLTDETSRVLYGYHFGICHALEMVLGL